MEGSVVEVICHISNKIKYPLVGWLLTKSVIQLSRRVVQ